MSTPLSSSSASTDNRELKLASTYVNETGCNVFLTGRAGTGKTTFLRTLREDCAKRMAVAAPTGVAAINAGGVTLHSLFQLPFGPLLPGTRKQQGLFRFSRKKKDMIRSLDLLVIDEISMVRADLLDGIDHVLRHLRRSERPFGGIQLLMIGDLFQLPPVVKENEWNLLNNHYESPYFFSSKALGDTELVVIELHQIYRQTDPAFINLLNKIRSDNLDPDDLAVLNSRVQTKVSQNDSDGTITLCSHNKQADEINLRKLAVLPETAHLFNAKVEGDFPDTNYPTPAILELKQGAQVMFIRNDPSFEKRYFNGKIGTVSSISDGSVLISCPNDDEEIEVEAATWENIDYQLNEKTQEINEITIGTFSQYPLRLAWAITIHKSQGLTFDKAIIDAQAAFAHGQTYVALSRCRSLAGMTLASPLAAKMVGVDNDVLHFHQRYLHKIKQKKDIHNAKKHYQQRLLLECFDFKRLQGSMQRLLDFIRNNHATLQITGGENLSAIAEQAEPEIFRVSSNFQHQLQGYFADSLLPAEDPHILDRITKGSRYFEDKMKNILMTPLSSFTFATDNQEIAKRLKNIVKFLKEEMAIKLAAISCCRDGFSPAKYFRAISAAAVEAQKISSKKKSPPTPDYSEADIDHPELFTLLKQWRKRKADEENIAHYRVLHQKTLIQLTVHLPDSLLQLSGVKGIGAKLLERYGDEIVNIIAQYRRDHNIEEINPPVATSFDSGSSAPKKIKTGTREVTLGLHKQGLTIPEIADKRQLARTTVETHIAYLIENGSIKADEIIVAARLAELSREIEKTGEKSLKAIKEKLPMEADYAEIRLTLAHLKYGDSRVKNSE